jgi:LysM repeat protein
MAAPVVAVSGVMAVAPAFLTAGHQALAQTSPHTITARLDAVVQPAARTYTVQPGDTLYGIALRYYSDGKYWPGLYQANRAKISNPDLIYAGQALTIPARHDVSTTPVTSTSSTATSSPSTSGPSTATSSRSTSAPSTSAPSTSAPSTSGPSSASAATTAQAGTGTRSSSGQSSSVQSDIADGNYLLAIGQYLVDNGYSKAAAAGVASCVDGESGGNPESVGSGGGGLIGWTPLGSAAPNGNIITGNISADMLAQLADIQYYNADEIGQSAVNGLNSQTDPVAAADFYSQNFEKPAVTNSDVRSSVAQQVFSELGG